MVSAAITWQSWSRKWGNWVAWTRNVTATRPTPPKRVLLRKTLRSKATSSKPRQRSQLFSATLSRPRRFRPVNDVLVAFNFIRLVSTESANFFDSKLKAPPMCSCV